MQQNGAVIAFLDANVLMQDPMCAGTTWQVFAHAPDSWQLRLVTSEIAVAEAVAGYKRELAYPFNRSSAGRRLARVVRPAGAPGSAGSHECSVAPRSPVGAEPCLESTRGPRIVHSGTRANQDSGYSG